MMVNYPAMVGRSRILVVEDDPELLRLYTTALSVAGFAAEGAADGLAALRSVERQRPDLIVLDLKLPCVDGWEFQQELAIDPRTRDIPIVVVTGTDLPINFQASAVFRKPVPPDRLTSTVANQLRATR